MSTLLNLTGHMQRRPATAVGFVEISFLVYEKTGHVIRSSRRCPVQSSAFILIM